MAFVVYVVNYAVPVN